MINWFKKRIVKAVYTKTAEDLIRDLLGRGIDWYDYKAMDEAGWLAYYSNAQALLKNEVFTNELDRFIADCLKNIAYETTNFNQVMNIRTGIVFLETLRDRIRGIENPRRPESTEENLNSAI
jgi:hypothetical protein